MRTLCSVLALLLGVGLIFLSFHIKKQQKEWVEQHKRVVSVKGNRTGAAVTGGVVGAVGGAATGAAIGGIGVVLCGTGFGIPAGAVMLGLAAIMGGVGAKVGHSVGTPDSTRVVIDNVVRSGPAYDSWIWQSLMAIAIVMIITAIIVLIKNSMFCKTEKQVEEKI